MKRFMYLFVCCVSIGFLAQANLGNIANELTINLRDAKQQGEMDQDDITSTIKAFEALYAYAPDDQKEKIAKNYRDVQNNFNNASLDLDKAKQQLQQAAQQAAPAAQPQAPAGIEGTVFNEIVKKAPSNPEDIPDYVTDALQYLFGQDNQIEKGSTVGQAIQSAPDDATKSQPGEPLTRYAQVNISKQKN